MEPYSFSPHTPLCCRQEQIYIFYFTLKVSAEFILVYSVRCISGWHTHTHTHTHTHKIHRLSPFSQERLTKRKLVKKQITSCVKTKRGIVNIQVFREFSPTTGSSFNLSISRTQHCRWRRYRSLYDKQSPDKGTFCTIHTVNTHPSPPIKERSAQYTLLIHTPVPR
jgi:hypothetical protein